MNLSRNFIKKDLQKKKNNNFNHSLTHLIKIKLSYFFSRNLTMKKKKR